MKIKVIFKELNILMIHNVHKNIKILKKLKSENQDK